jgi:hypothetical protein
MTPRYRFIERRKSNCVQGSTFRQLKQNRLAGELARRAGCRQNAAKKVAG